MLMRSSPLEVKTCGSSARWPGGTWNSKSESTPRRPAGRRNKGMVLQFSNQCRTKTVKVRRKVVHSGGWKKLSCSSQDSTAPRMCAGASMEKSEEVWTRKLMPLLPPFLSNSFFLNFAAQSLVLLFWTTPCWPGAANNFTSSLISSPLRDKVAKKQDSSSGSTANATSSNSNSILWLLPGFKCKRRSNISSLTWSSGSSMWLYEASKGTGKLLTKHKQLETTISKQHASSPSNPTFTVQHKCTGLPSAS
mmetsp:Transcript_107568/g.343189  ORF Transcript_107568/g.343189 Transcript_107568/m.343189 type:complete len:249 (-) Transcript_107568:719-1465(-)